MLSTAALHIAQPCSALAVPVPSLDKGDRATVGVYVAIHCHKTAQYTLGCIAS